jgi:RsiW-degrading membrane proteinase PrsW (M82 family)
LAQTSRSPLKAFRIGASLFVAVVGALFYQPATHGGPAIVMVVGRCFYVAIFVLLAVALLKARQGAAALLHLVIRDSGTLPHFIATFASGVGELLGPILGAVVLSWCVDTGFPER